MELTEDVLTSLSDEGYSATTERHLFVAFVETGKPYAVLFREDIYNCVSLEALRNICRTRKVLAGINIPFECKEHR